jgi:starch-binding outer membrane protein, SusD/RagB family
MRLHNATRRLAAGVLALTLAGCQDVTVEPKSTVTSGNIFTDPGSYKAFLAKLYAGLAVTGQSGPDGNPDIDRNTIDEGYSQYLRTYWQLQELPTDEAIIGWGDPGLPEMNKQEWSASNVWVTGMFARIYFQIALVNQFLRETSDDKLGDRGVSGALKSQIQGYRSEARFLRALSYWHALDLYRNIPVVDENFDVGRLPTQATPQQAFDFIESELKAIRPQLPPVATGEFYGRASQGAVDLLLAKLYLNAETYGLSPHFSEARDAAAAVIAQSQYSLDPNYMRLFSIDNTASPEVVFAIPFDGERTRTWGGLTFLVHAAVGGDMNPATYGIDGGWWGLRTRKESVARFQSGDTRMSYFFFTNQSLSISNIGDFHQGVAVPKFRNITTSGTPGKNSTHPDTDFPLFRLADAYLIYAEAVLRGNDAAHRAQALTYVNALQQRAFGNATHNLVDAQLTLPWILDERGRELFLEGTRRTDLVRFGQFTTAGIWEWKGGVQAGKTTEAYRNIYPIPSNDLSANPLLKQNSGY